MLTAELERILADEQLFHSEYQLRNFVVGGPGMTDYARYRQAVMELRARTDSIRGQFVKRREMALRCHELADAISRKPTSGKQRIVHNRHALELDQMDWNRSKLDAAMRDTYREFIILFKLAAALKERVGDLGNGRREQLERERWALEAKYQLAMDMTAGGGPTRQTWGLIMSLDHDRRRELIDEIRGGNPSALAEWLVGIEAPKALAMSQASLPTLDDLKEEAGGLHDTQWPELIAD